MPAKIIQPYWKKGEIIRNKHTGKPLRVLQVFAGTGSLVVELESDTDPIITKAIQEKDYDSYALDSDMEYNENTNTFIYKHLEL